MLNQPFTNVQLEILKVFSDDLSDEHMKKLKRHLAQFYYEIMTDAANKVWDEEGWDDAKVQELLNTKLRASKSYKPNEKTRKIIEEFENRK